MQISELKLLSLMGKHVYKYETDICYSWYTWCHCTFKVGSWLGTKEYILETILIMS